DHLVGTVFQRETVRITTGQHGTELGTELLHGDAHGCRLLAINQDVVARLVDLQVAVSEEEFLAGIGAPDDLISKGLQVLGWLSGTDHHLHWRAATCGRQRWRCKHHEVHASDLRDFALDLLHRRGGTGLALIPLLEYKTGN